MVGVQARREQAEYAISCGLSQRRACTLLSISRNSLYYCLKMPVKDKPIVDAMKTLSSAYPRFRARRIRALLARQGIKLGKHRCSRIWSDAHLQVPKKRRRKRAASVPRRMVATMASRVWSYDFVYDELPLTSFLVDYVRQHEKQLLTSWFKLQEAVKIFPELTEFLIEYVAKHREKFLFDMYNQNCARRIFPTGVGKFGLGDPQNASASESLEKPSAHSSGLFAKKTSAFKSTAGKLPHDYTDIHLRYTNDEIYFAAQAAVRVSGDGRAATFAKLYMNPHAAGAISPEDIKQMVINFIHDEFLTYREPDYQPKVPEKMSREDLADISYDELVRMAENTGAIDYDVLDERQACAQRPTSQ